MRGKERGGERDPIGIRQTQKDKGGGGGGGSICTLLATVCSFYSTIFLSALFFSVDTFLFAGCTENNELNCTVL